MGKAELRINVSRTDQRVTRSLILETSCRANRRMNLSVQINVRHDNLIFPNDRRFTRIFHGDRGITETYFIISYENKDLKIENIQDHTNKFTINYRKVSNFSEILDLSPPGSRGRSPGINIKEIIAAWRIDIITDFERIKGDFSGSNQAVYRFIITTNDKDFTNITINNTFTLRNHITAYPSTINIYLDQHRHGETINRKLYLASEGRSSFHIKSIKSDMNELDFDYDTGSALARHTIDVNFHYKDGFSKQTATITILTDHPSQEKTEVPIFFLTR